MFREVEKYLFISPEDGEGFLAFIATLQSLFKDLSHPDRQTKFEATVCSLWPEGNFLVETLPNTTLGCPCFHTGLKAWDLVYKFDTEVAYQLAKPTGKHITQAMGVLVGAESPPLPEIFCPETKQDLDVVFTGGVDHKVLRKFWETVHPEFDRVAVLEDDTTLSDALRTLARARTVVGQRSVYTYLAASIKPFRGIVELYPSDTYRQWLSKWANPLYHMVAGETTNETIFRAMEQAWRTYRKRQESLTPMEQPTSIVDSAGR